MAQLRNLTVDGKEIWDLLYPIGSIYQTTASGFDPSQEWGGYGVE